MRPSAFTLRPRLLVQVAAASLLAAFAAGCSADVERFASNPFSNPFASNQQEPVQTGSIGAGGYGAAPSGSVSAEPLPPVGQQPQQYGQQQPYNQGQYSQQPQQYGQGQYAQPSAGQSQSSWNSPVNSAPGQQQPMGNSAMNNPTVQASGSMHTVAAGETIYSVARLYGVKAQDIATLNGMNLDTKVRVGQSLSLPTGARSGNAKAAPLKENNKTAAATTGALPAATAASQMPSVRPGASQQPTQLNNAPTAPATTAQAPAATVSKTVARPETTTPATQPTRSASQELAFRWPVQGRIISGFGPKPNGVANEGVNLAVPEGTPIRASEGGVVVYSGNELKGYGNLVLVRHANGYVTAYAHASQLDVKRGDQVRRGQVIGKTGQSGDVSSPQLHFEVRKGSTPVDPMKYLKAGG